MARPFTLLLWVRAFSEHVFASFARAITHSAAVQRLAISLAATVALALLPALPSAAPIHAHVPATLVASSGWLDRLNLWRAAAAVPPVTENALWSTGDYDHSLYMVKNDLVTHYETPGVPYYSVPGDTAAKNSNIEVNSTTNVTDEQSIDWWMGAPFHAMGMMDPRLQQTGFGSYREVKSGWQAGFSLDDIHGNSFTGGNYPVYFPGNGTTEPLTTYSGNEFPDPLQACPGYSVPTGLPVFIQVGGNVSTTAGPVHTFTGNGVALPHCVIDSSNSALSSYLVARGGVILIPQQPLQSGVTYTVALTVNGAPHAWSFTVGPFRAEPAGWQSLGGVLTSGPDAASSGTTSTDVFVRGTDNQMWSIHWNGTSFGNFMPRGGMLTSDPGSVAQSATKTDVFVRGTDNQLWTIESNSGAFGNWVPLGGGLTSGPGADAWAGATAHMDAFVRGTDNQLWHKWSDNGTWSFWEPLGGVLSSDPGAVSWSPNRSDVFVRGSDNQLWHKWFDGIAWRPWEPLGGVLTTSPDATSCQSGHLDVFVIGTDHGLWQLGFNGTSWTGWKPLGGNWVSSASAVCSTGTSTVTLFGRGTDNALWTRSVPGS